MDVIEHSENADGRGQHAADRLNEARSVAAALLDELELGSSPIMASLLKAQRLARLMRDAHAQRWLNLEIRGYEGGLNLTQELGGCLKYALQGGRLRSDDKYWVAGLPELEATVRAAESGLSSIMVPENWTAE